MPKGDETVTEALEVLQRFWRLSPRKKRIFLDHLDRMNEATDDAAEVVALEELRTAFAQANAEENGAKDL